MAYIGAMRRSFTRTLVLLFALAILWATYDNVLRANDDVQAMADRAASMVKPPAEKHGMTKMDRTPLKETFEFTWASGVVAVECGRAYWVVGDRACKVVP
jgi:hypothetical protein